MASMRLVESFANPPGKCFICKNSHHNNDIVFLGQMFQQIGIGLHRGDTMYVCEDCVREMASLYGIFADDNPNQISLREQLDDLQSVNEALNEQVAQYEIDIAALTGGLLERLQSKHDDDQPNDVIVVDETVDATEPVTLSPEELQQLNSEVILDPINVVPPKKTAAKPKRGRPAKKVTDAKDNS